MRRYAILGYPLAHTLSPFIHTRLFALSGESGEYGRAEISPEALDAEMPNLKSLDGFNVTIPHKEAVIPWLDRLDPSAERYRAVNVVRCTDGACVGYNTDAFGFRRAIELLGTGLSGRVLLLGAGGAGRMMAMETVLCGGRLTVAVRNADAPRTRALLTFLRERVPEARVRICGLDEIDGAFDLLCNSTPVGMYPKTDECPVAEAVVSRSGAVFDAVYNPVETVLLRRARALRIPARGGMDMLVWQAVRAHEIWYGGRFAQSDVESLIEACNGQLTDRA